MTFSRTIPLLFCSLTALAQTEIPLYPSTPPNSKPGVSITEKRDVDPKSGILRISNVQTPTLSSACNCPPTDAASRLLISASVPGRHFFMPAEVSKINSQRSSGAGCADPREPKTKTARPATSQRRATE